MVRTSKVTSKVLTMIYWQTKTMVQAWPLETSWRAVMARRSLMIAAGQVKTLKKETQLGNSKATV